MYGIGPVALVKRAKLSSLGGIFGLTACLSAITPVAPATASTSASAATKASTIAPAEILSSRTTKMTLGPAGGALQVRGTVRHTQTCQLKMLWAPAVNVVYSHNPTTSCHGGNYAANVIVGPNRTGKTRTIAFHLIARNPASSAGSALYVTVAPVVAKPPATTTTTSPTTTTTASTSTSTTTTTPTATITAMTTTGPVSDVQSQNWSGYTAYGGPFTAARGTFTVPTVSSGGQDADLSEWVGIDGADNQSLIQAGVIEAVGGPGGTTQVEAWWEILPAAATSISSMDVSPGDSVTVTIWQVSGTTWGISVADKTSGQQFSTKQSYDGPGQSAEWIVEAPTDARDNQITPLAGFSPAVTFSALGTAGPVSRLEDDSLVQGDAVVATPSAITASGFNVANTDNTVEGRAPTTRRLGPAADYGPQLQGQRAPF